MSLTYQEIASDLAPMLDLLIESFLDDKTDKNRYDLSEFLWDNKVGILRILQAQAVLK